MFPILSTCIMWDRPHQCTDATVTLIYRHLIGYLPLTKTLGQIKALIKSTHFLPNYMVAGGQHMYFILDVVRFLFLNGIAIKLNHRGYASISSNTFRKGNSSPLAAIEAGLTSGITRIRTCYTTSTGMPDHSWKRA